MQNSRMMELSVAGNSGDMLHCVSRVMSVLARLLENMSGKMLIYSGPTHRPLRSIWLIIVKAKCWTRQQYGL